MTTYRAAYRMVVESAIYFLADSARLPILVAVEQVDPTEELTGQCLRDLILWCIEWGKLDIGYDLEKDKQVGHGGQDRMAERSITGGQIVAALSRGTLRTDGRSGLKWRYLARKNAVEVSFMFDLDDEGNVLIILTVMNA